MYPFLRSLDWTAIATWDELERAIVALPTAQTRGDAFEEFCHAYFTLHKDLYQVQQVWRFSQIPLTILHGLGGASNQDLGIDGILLHHDATITAYQSKSRANRSDIPSQRELATFYMVSDRADFRGHRRSWMNLPFMSRREA